MGAFFFCYKNKNEVFENVESNYVINFLNLAGYPQYVEQFKKNGFESKSEIKLLTVELLIKMRVKAGHAEVIMNIIRKQNNDINDSVPLVCKSILNKVPVDAASLPVISNRESIASDVITGSIPETTVVSTQITDRESPTVVSSSLDPWSSTTCPCSPDVSTLPKLFLPPSIAQIKTQDNDEEKLVRYHNNFHFIKPNPNACNDCVNNNHYYYSQIDDTNRLQFDQLHPKPYAYSSEPRSYFFVGVMTNQIRCDNKEISFQCRLAPEQNNWQCYDDDSRFDRHYKLDLVGHEFPEPDYDTKSGRLQLLRLQKGETVNNKKVKYFYFYFLFLMLIII